MMNLRVSKVRIEFHPMPIFFQHPVNANTRLGIWRIDEAETFFRDTVPHHRDVSHPHKRVQHLAGRFLLRYLYPDFPYELIRIADTRKPYLPNEDFHFSISHCGDYAAAIVSKTARVGIDIEAPVAKIEKLEKKFSTPAEQELFKDQIPSPITALTLIWSAKEAVFKWYGLGNVDFREHIHLQKLNTKEQKIEAFFKKIEMPLSLEYKIFENLILCTLTINI